MRPDLVRHARPYGHTARPVRAGAMDAAVDGGMIPLSPCRNIPLPKIERGEPRFLTPDEVHAIVDAIRKHYRTRILTAAHLGPRWGELAGLRPTRIDLLHRKLDIVEQATELKGRLELGAPLKTAASRRTITIPRFLVPLLDEQISRNTEVVFASREGTPLRRTNFRRRVWLPATRAAGVDGVRFHDLRHSAVAFAIDRGAHPRAIQELMGHSSINTTLNVYGGLFPRLEETIADGLDELYVASSKGGASTQVTELSTDLPQQSVPLCRTVQYRFSAVSPTRGDQARERP